MIRLSKSVFYLLCIASVVSSEDKFDLFVKSVSVYSKSPQDEVAVVVSKIDLENVVDSKIKSAKITFFAFEEGHSRRFPGLEFVDMSFVRKNGWDVKIVPALEVSRESLQSNRLILGVIEDYNLLMYFRLVEGKRIVASLSLAEARDYLRLDEDAWSQLSKITRLRIWKVVGQHLRLQDDYARTRNRNDGLEEFKR